jgi:hypothetical protein
MRHSGHAHPPGQNEPLVHGHAAGKASAAAGLCEPRLLRATQDVFQVPGVLDGITASLLDIADRRGTEFRALRKGLRYCWSVAVAPGRYLSRLANAR